MTDTKFAADYSKRLSKCQKCKQELPKGAIRLAKLAANHFHDGDGDMKTYYHIKCLFETFQRARATSKVIESTDEIEGFQTLQDSDKNSIIEMITGKATSSLSSTTTLL
jgi:DNA ligase-3